MKATSKLPNESDQHNRFTFVNVFCRVVSVHSTRRGTATGQLALGETCEQTIVNYTRAERLFLPQIEDVSGRFCRTGYASTTCKAITYFLGLRSNILLIFLSKFTIPAGPDTYVSIIPFPSLPPLHVAQWFLIDWWRCWGPVEIASRRLQDSFFKRIEIYAREQQVTNSKRPSAYDFF
jgi:hypothetical protein